MSFLERLRFARLPFGRRPSPPVILCKECGAAVATNSGPGGPMCATCRTVYQKTVEKNLPTHRVVFPGCLSPINRS